jgi:hypothetical protein
MTVSNKSRGFQIVACDALHKRVIFSFFFSVFKRSDTNVIHRLVEEDDDDNYDDYVDGMRLCL